MEGSSKKTESEKYGKKYLFEVLLSAVFVAVTAVAVSLFFGYSYMANDDVMLKNIINGTYTGRPDAHMIYVMYPLALIWKMLYILLPKIEWYDIFSVGMHYLCWFFIILAAGLVGHKKSEKAIGEAVAFFLLLLLDFPYLVMEHYTLLAGLMAGTAIFYYMLGKDAEKKISLFRVVVIVFMLLCLLLRKQVFLLSLPIGGIILLYRLIIAPGRQERKREWLHSGIMIGIILVCTVFFYGMEALAYKTPEWTEFLAYNKARTDAFDYYLIGNYSEFEEDYKTLGITGSDYAVLVDYNTQLIPGLDSKVMGKITELGKLQQKMDRSFKGRIKDALFLTFSVMVRQPIQPVGILLTLAFVQAALLMLLKGKWKEGIPKGLLFCYLFGVLFVFLYKKRFPEHVAYSFYFILLAALSGAMIGKGQLSDLFKKDKLKKVFVISVLFVSVFLAGFRIGLTRNKISALQAKTGDWRTINEYCEAHVENVYLMATKSFVFSAEAVGEDRGLEADNTLRLGTWVENSPLQKERMSNLGISTPFEAFYQDRNFYLMQSKDWNRTWIEAFYQERGCMVETYVEDVLKTSSGAEFEIIGIRDMAGSNQ